MALCLAYLLVFPATAPGMAVLIAIGTMTVTALGRSDEIGLTAITTAVVMIVAAGEPSNAWIQPLLRLFDTLIGISVGVLCKWVASFAFSKVSGEEAR